MSRRSRSMFGWACVAALWACQGETMSGAQSAQAQSAAAVPSSPGTPAQNLVNAYITLQAKLAKDDAAGSKAAYLGLQNALKAKDLGLDPATEKKLSSAAAQGAAASKLADARTAFAGVTDALLAYLGAAKNPLSTPLTVAHCPMALDNKGAKWLQLGDKLENPYFGSEMLRCGSVEKTVQPGKSL
jgi:membrane fusion protein, copper/silver efflux system